MNANRTRRLAVAPVAAILMAALVLPAPANLVGETVGAPPAQAPVAAKPGLPPNTAAFTVASRASRLAAARARARRAAARRARARRAAAARAARYQGAQARRILASLRSRYPRYLRGTTVVIGNAHGYQAISYYTIGKIVISPRHRASLSRILNHEIWHIIDWRDNRHIDWGERVPPSHASRYR